MSIFETYFLISTDTLVSNLAFNNSSGMFIKTIKIFKTYKLHLLILIVSSLAFLVAAIINYIPGKIFYRRLTFTDN